MEVFLGTICAFGFNFAPRGWSTCAGQLVSIAQNTALFSLMGTYYGGDGQTTFGLPDFQGRVPISQGTSLGQTYVMGQKAGSNSVTLTVNNMPGHTHTGSLPVNIPAYSDGGNTSNPGGARLAVSTGVNMYTNQNPDLAMKPFPTTVTIGIAGSSQPFGVTDPYLAINYSIAMEGIFPSRD